MRTDDRPEIHGDIPAAASEQGMADRKELASFAFQRTRMPMVVADAREPDMRIVLANDAFVELTGYCAEEIIGRNCRFLQGPDTSPVAVAEIRAAIAQRRDATIEILNYKKDGTPFWNQLHLSALRDEAGAVAYFFASQVDVTELRRVQTLEEAEHRLLLEVDHRTKNVLAIVDSIVRLSKSENSAAYSASVKQRVQALSRTHMLLAESGWQEVSLESIIRTQVAVFGGDQVDVQGPEIMVPAPSVQPLGLAVHELAANAAVHGSLSRGKGTLSIDWRKEGNGLVLHWNEEGGPVPAERHGHGFGTVLLGAVVEKQLGGSIHRTWGNGGLQLRIELPSLDRVGGGLRHKP
ncbi:HWE histidine kinase domain-containing protein [Rhizobium sp. BK377]|uniref:blue-light-activated histidine kinase n=1 Tax=Rhizobium sp. BK377 TaxID=2587058 RepID=UPI00162057CB|nr:PAS domain-containing protein [Rhizobium sp. BK377]